MSRIIQYHTTITTTAAPILLLVAARIVLRVGMRLYKGNVDGGNEASTTESGSIAFWSSHIEKTSYGCGRMIQGTFNPRWLCNRIGLSNVRLNTIPLQLRMHHLYPWDWLMSICFHYPHTNSLVPYFNRNLATIKSKKIVSIVILPVSAARGANVKNVKERSRCCNSDGSWILCWLFLFYIWLHSIWLFLCVIVSYVIICILSCIIWIASTSLRCILNDRVQNARLLLPCNRLFSSDDPS